MKYRKKPVVIDAMRFIGGRDSADEVLAFIGGGAVWHFNHETISIPTLEGTMSASVGDWIIKGVKGEFYPCKPDIFEATYESAAAPAQGTELHALMNEPHYQGSPSFPGGGFATSTVMVSAEWYAKLKALAAHGQTPEPNP